MQRGQNMLTPQSMQTVHPAKSHSLSVCPKISQSFSVNAYGVAVDRGTTFFVLRRLGIFIFSPHRSSAIVSAFLDTWGSHMPK